MGIMNRHRQDRVPRTSTLIAFETVARHGSVSGAARELGVLQSSVSRQISGLERQFQVRLFDRSTSGVRLTEAGRQVYDATLAALGLLETAFEEAARRSSGEGVVLACSHDAAHLMILPRYDALRTALGETAQIRLLTYQRQVEELEPVGTADITLSWLAPEAEDRVLMIEEQLQPICAPAYAAAHPEAVAGLIRDWGGLTPARSEAAQPGLVYSVQPGLVVLAGLVRTHGAAGIRAPLRGLRFLHPPAAGCDGGTRGGVGLALLDRVVPGGRNAGATRRRVCKAPRPLLCLAYPPRAEESLGPEVSRNSRTTGVTH